MLATYPIRSTSESGICSSRASERARWTTWRPPSRLSRLSRVMLRTAWMSVARLAIAPVQDVLGLGSAERMNLPGTADGNWGWRVAKGALDAGVAERLRSLTATYGRLDPGV